MSSQVAGEAGPPVCGFPFMHRDFSTMTTPTLIIAGNTDTGGPTALAK